MPLETVIIYQSNTSKEDVARDLAIRVDDLAVALPHGGDDVVAGFAARVRD